MASNYEWDRDTAIDQIAQAVQCLLAPFEKPRQGIDETPMRVARAYYDELLSGYRLDPADLFKTFENDAEYSEMVLVRDIPFYSLCEHHMLPFHGVAHVGYIPKTHVIGLSKIARLVQLFSRRLQVQERLTVQIADCIVEHLTPLGVMVVMEAEHLCINMRGIQKPGSTTTTSAIRGVFADPEDDARKEFLALLERRPR